MQRRRYLRTVGAVAAIGFAGCSGDGGSGDGDGGDGDDGGGGTAERDAAYYIAQAVSQLNTAAIALADYQDRFSEGNDDEIEFDEEQQAERLSTARSALDSAASENPSDEEAAQIEGLRAAADALESASSAISELRIATDELDELEPAIRDRDFATARQRLSAPADRVSAVAESIGSASRRLNERDAERMAATNLRYAELRDGITELADLTGSFDQLLTGYDHMIAAGERLTTARDQFDEERYRDARSTLGEGETAAANAQSTFETGREDAPERLAPRFETGVCRSGHLSQSISLLDDAVSAALDGRREDASDLRSEAEREFQAIEDC